MKFSPAKSIKLYRKLAVYGGIGVGKSILGLSSPGKLLVLDTEAGTIPFASLRPFDVLHTQAFGDVKGVIDDLASNPPAEETTLVIDSASIIWAGLQQAMLEKKLTVAGIKAMDGTEKVQFAMADWGILKRWHSDIMNTLMSLKCHVVCTFRESEVRDETTFKGTGEFVPQWEKNTGYVFDFVGRVNKRTFTFTKGRLAIDGKLIDLTGKKVKIPDVKDGADLPKIWEALFGAGEYVPNGAAPVPQATPAAILESDPEAIRLAHELHKTHIPKAGIAEADLTVYLLNKEVDGKKIATLSADGKFHFGDMAPKWLNWLIEGLEDPARRMQLIKKIQDIKDGVK